MGMAPDGTGLRDFTAETDLHRWAAEAMTARPTTSGSPPPVDLCPPSPLQLRRESEGAGSWTSKTSAPPAASTNSSGSTFDREPRYYSSALERSLSPKSRSNHFLAGGLRAERPTSMYATPTLSGTETLESQATMSAREYVDASSQPHLKSCLKTAATSPRLYDNGFEPTTSGQSSAPLVSAAPQALGKSVHISSNLPRHREPSTASTLSSDSSTCSPMRLRAAKRNVGPIRHDTDEFVAPDERTPRPRDSKQSASPTWTTSTYDSEEDAPVLMTPLDEDGPQCTGATPPLDTLGDGVADRVGINRGIGHIGAGVAEPLQLLTELRAPTRRMSGTKLSAPSAATVEPPLPQQQQQPASGASHSATPALSRSTLLDIGLAKGTTPPATRGSAVAVTEASHVPISADIGSIVTAGLEMGLGVRMASSALAGQLPPSSSSGIQNVAEPRFQRMAAPGMLDMSQLAMTLAITNTQSNGHVLPPQSAHRSEDTADDLSRDAVEREEAELARRRTTGGLRRDAQARPVGKRRPQRLSTQDPHGDNREASPRSSFGHARHSSESYRPDYQVADESRSGKSFRTSGLGGSPILETMALHPATSNTPLGTPSHGRKALVSPSLHQLEAESYMSRTTPEYNDTDDTTHDTPAGRANKQGVFGPLGAVTNLEGGLMGIGESGHFGPGVRAKVSEVIESLIHTVPLSGDEGEAVSLIEYGALNSRSGLLLRPAISSLAKRANAMGKLTTSTGSDAGTAKTDYFGKIAQKGNAATAAVEPSRATFCITHEDSPSVDFRPMTAMMESHTDSYLDPHWQSSHSPCMTHAVFPSFTARPFAARVVPPRTVNLGMSLMDLHWMHTPSNASVTRATSAQAELTAFLKTRAQEFKKDGLLVVAYIARSEDPVGAETSPIISSSPTDATHEPLSADSASRSRTHSRSASLQGKRDIWSALSNTLAPCIQRLVSCGMLKSDVARHLLNLPMHPRSAPQTEAVLKSVENQWKLEWSCGLGHNDPITVDGKESRKRSEPLPLRLAHPAWTTYQSGCLASVPFTEHMIQLFKNLYESHFRSVLREKGRLSKGAVEFVLDSLWDALFSRIVDKNPNPISNVEIEVCICALRRR